MLDQDRFECLVVVIELQLNLVDILLEVEGEDALDDIFLLFGGEVGLFEQLLEHSEARY